MSRATSLVAREHELERALHSLRFSGGVLITGEAGAGQTYLAACVAPGHRSRRASVYRKLGIASRSELQR